MSMVFRQLRESLTTALLLFLFSSLAWGRPEVTAVVNAGSFAVGPVCPGEILVIYGVSLGPASLVSYQINSAGRLATSLSGTRVLFDGVAAPLIYVSDRQLSAIAPYALAGKKTTSLQVEANGTASAALSLDVAEAAPGIFQLGGGQAAALNQDTSVNGLLNPAAPDSIVVVYGTGEGMTSPAGVDGSLATGPPFPAPINKATLKIGDLTSEILYAGSAPGAPMGLFQVNARIPAGAGVGHVPVVLSVSGASSPPGPTIAIAPADPIGIASVSAAPAAVGKSVKSTITVTLNGPAPAGGAWIALATDNSLLTLESPIHVSSGATSASITAVGPAVASASDVRITAAILSSTASTTLRIVPPSPAVAIQSVTAAPADASSIQVSATLASAAPLGGVALDLTSDNAGVEPATLVIAAGGVTGQVRMPVIIGSGIINATITARYGLVSRSTTIATALPGWVTDPSGDAKPANGPDLVAAAATLSNGVLTLRAKFAKGAFNPKTTAVLFYVDVDQNPATGSPPVSGDNGFGADLMIAVGAGYSVPNVKIWWASPPNFVNRSPTMNWVTMPDGVEVRITGFAGMRLQNTMNYRVLTQTWISGNTFSTIVDVVPDLGKSPGVSAPATTSLGQPSLLSPPEGAIFGTYPRTTVLSWSAVSGALAYEVQVDWWNRGPPAGWLSEGFWLYIFAETNSLSYTFDFVGKQPGRWRVFAVDQNGHAGPPSDWRIFEYSL